jgi:hypothetical protein
MYLPSDCEFLYQYVLKDQEGEVVWESILHRRQRNLESNYSGLYSEDRPWGQSSSTSTVEVDSKANQEETLDARESLLPPPTFECHDVLQKEKRASMLACIKGQKVFGNVRMSVSGGIYDGPDGAGAKRGGMACARTSEFHDCEDETPVDSDQNSTKDGDATFQDAEEMPLTKDVLAEMEQIARERDALEKERRLVCEEVRRAIKMLRDQTGCDAVDTHKSRASYCPEGGQLYDSLRVLQLAISTQFRTIETLNARAKSAEAELAAVTAASDEERRSAQEAAAAAAAALQEEATEHREELQRRAAAEREESAAALQRLQADRDALAARAEERERAHAAASAESAREAAALREQLRERDERIERADMRARRLRTGARAVQGTMQGARAQFAALRAEVLGLRERLLPSFAEMGAQLQERMASYAVEVSADLDDTKAKFRREVAERRRLHNQVRAAGRAAVREPREAPSVPGAMACVRSLRCGVPFPVFSTSGSLEISPRRRCGMEW